MNYFDCHADTLTEIGGSGGTLEENTGNLDLKRVGEFVEHYTQIFAIWKDAALVKTETREKDFFRLYDMARAYLLEENRKIQWCLSGEDMIRAHKQRRGAAFLAIEDVSVMGDYVEKVRELGFRFAMLTWNYENCYGCGAATDRKKGLTEKGRDLVKRLTEEKIVLDISHLSDQGAEDVFSLTGEPVIASHSNARAICDNPRNLPDSLIRELISRKGLIGINFYRDFVGGNFEVQDLIRHIDHILELGGEDVLALGGDFDGCHGNFPDGIRGVESVPELRDEMLKHGFSENLTEKIFYENANQFVIRNVR